MYNVPVAGAWWHAVGAPLDRMVRRRRVHAGRELHSFVH